MLKYKNNEIKMAAPIEFVIETVSSPDGAKLQEYGSTGLEDCGTAGIRKYGTGRLQNYINSELREYRTAEMPGQAGRNRQKGRVK